MRVVSTTHPVISDGKQESNPTWYLSADGKNIEIVYKGFLYRQVPAIGEAPELIGRYDGGAGVVFRKVRKATPAEIKAAEPENALVTIIKDPRIWIAVGLLVAIYLSGGMKDIFKPEPKLKA